MTTNFKTNGVDLDDLLLKKTESKIVPPDFRNYESGYWDSVGLGYSWGAANYYLLGNGLNTGNKSSPIQIGSTTEWKKIDSVASGNSPSSFGIKNDGTLWVWGYPILGASNTSVPSQAGTDSDWKTSVGKPNTSGGSALLIKNNGTLWAWGYNSNGELGTGNTTTVVNITQVGNLSNWDSVSGNGPSSFGIKTDGTLWAWGENTYGQLGLGDRTHRSSPVQVGALTNWKQVTSAGYSTIAIKTDGTLWSWGNNTSGQLGLGDRTHRSSPVQVGSLTNWKMVASTFYGTVAIKTDGTMWACGDDTTTGAYYSLGLQGSTTSSPVQVGSATNWSFIDIGTKHSLAIKTDGTLWAVGFNGQGQLGDLTTSTKSTFTRVSTPSSTWSLVKCGYYQSYGIAYS